jgi:hypothetical protein
MYPDSDKHAFQARVCFKLKTALGALLEALEYAEDTGSDPWDFAIAIRRFFELGLTETDLRWLVRKGYVMHAREVTSPDQLGRAFRPTGDLTFGKRTCFVLSGAGVAMARSLLPSVAMPSEHAGQGTDAGGEENGHGRSAAHGVPHWDAEIRELRWNGQLVKRFKWQAANQEIVLTAFEEDGWPARIDDPLPPHAEQDSKRRLSDTIKCLNRKQQHELIRFRGDGTGEGIAWEFVPTNGTSPRPADRSATDGPLP